MTQKEFQKYFEKQNNCVFKNQGCKSAKDRIDNNYWERNELIDGNWKIIDVPCNFTTSPQGACESSSACYSGITLSAGVDMGQHNAQSLKNWDVTPQAHPNLYNILEPLLNTGQACEAENNLQRIHPHISTDESQKLISLVFPVYLKRLAYQFQQITGDDFYELPAGTQTALFDYFYNQGNIYNLVTMSNGQINWDHAMDVLDTDGGGKPHSRFTKDYHKIQNDFVNESLKEYDVCQKRKV